VDTGYYDDEILTKYTPDEFKIMDTYIDHGRDFEMTYVAMEQWRGKYLVKNRVTGQIFETPQMAYILIAATLFANYPKETRLKWVKDYYDSTSLHDISLPTPVMSGVRTPERQFSSCVLIESDDSIDSINATTSSIVRYVSKKAGIGINAGKIRAIGSPIRKGDAYHTGMVPFIKLFQSAVKSCNQGGIRGGAATLYFPFWHYEYEDLIVLKNNKGTEENRARHMDYGVQFNKLAYERLLTGGNITLFSPSDVPGLYDAFFQDQDKFKILYELAERDPKIRKKTIKAIDLFTQFMQERKNTGRIYIMNVDHANTHSSFIESVAPIRQSNLCLVGDTMVTVQMEDGSIEDIYLKDVTTDMKVYSRNLKLGKDEFRQVLASAKTMESAKLIKITDEKTGASIKCTPEHKIYTKNRGYVEAKELLETDELLIE
jgi:ribonucleoside-diphosphate reductase alpha chain